MRSPRTLSRYLAREVTIHSLLGLAAVGVVLVSRHVLRLLDEVIGAGLGADELARLLGYIAATLAPYALPIAFLFGAIAAMGRLSADSEIMAMRACGLGLRAVAGPVVALGVLISGLTWYLVFEVEPSAQHGLRMLVKSIAARGAMVQPGRFQEMDDRIFYARSRDSEQGFQGVVVSDHSDPTHPFTIFAETGRITLDEDRGALVFRLENGDIEMEPADPSSSQRFSFERFDYAFEAAGLLGGHFASLRPREMSLAQLRSVIARAAAGDSLDDLRRKQPVRYELHLHRRFALPAAPALFALVAVPLGVRRVRGARAWGAMACGVLAFGYYALLTASQALAVQGRLPAAVALWTPNAVFAVLGITLLVRERRLGR